MPRMDGFEAIKQIRAMADDHWVPIIILSARDRESEKIAALDLGADEVERTRLLRPACASCLQVRAAKFCRYAEIAWGARRSCGCKLYTGWQRSTSI